MNDPGQRPLRVLFLFTRNSARSQSAEALLARKGRDRFVAGSAGTDPGSQVHPMAVGALREFGIDWTDGEPKGIPEVRDQRWDLVITVCDRARETCPALPGQPVFAHWGMEDPAAEPEEGRRQAAFRQTVLYLSRRIDLLLALPFETLERRALEMRVQEIGGPPEAAAEPKPIAPET